MYEYIYIYIDKFIKMQCPSLSIHINIFIFLSLCMKHSGRFFVKHSGPCSLERRWHGAVCAAVDMWFATRPVTTTSHLGTAQM